jgi:hypothetical protein
MLLSGAHWAARITAHRYYWIGLLGRKVVQNPGPESDKSRKKCVGKGFFSPHRDFSRPV